MAYLKVTILLSVMLVGVRAAVIGQSEFYDDMNLLARQSTPAMTMGSNRPIGNFVGNAVGNLFGGGPLGSIASGITRPLVSGGLGLLSGGLLSRDEMYNSLDASGRFFNLPRPSPAHHHGYETHHYAPHNYASHNYNAHHSYAPHNYGSHNYDSHSYENYESEHYKPKFY